MLNADKNVIDLWILSMESSKIYSSFHRLFLYALRRIYHSTSPLFNG